MRPFKPNTDHVSMINPNTYNSLYGMPMQQSWQDLVIWEWFLNRARAKSIVELGTGNGAFSCYLLSQCIARQMHFATLDRKEPEQSLLHQKLGLRRLFRKMNLMSLEAKSELGVILSQLPRPVVLFCDNGDKPHEIAIFCDLLKAGDYVGVHDYGIEFHEHHLDPIRDRVVELMAPEEAISNTRFYEVIL